MAEDLAVLLKTCNNPTVISTLTKGEEQYGLILQDIWKETRGEL